MHRRIHRTRNTVNDTAWCRKCKTFTLYVVNNGTLSYCLPCHLRAEDARAVAAARPQQRMLPLTES